ncbi:hypothetical protein [Desertivirga xinjiangensis]|uniref:hypothetical protein n=1 Tax=Desertivirga xinjiangensis TaxID=539206 RepID=UPI0021098C54|nr:hypothetical protein [Pedobacter xinjiangensis]
MKRLLTLVILLFALSSFAQKKVSATELSNYIGDSVTVCDKVYGGRFLQRTSITLLSVGKEFPYHLLTIVIKGGDRDKFKYKPEDALVKKSVCVTGKLTEYGGKPQIIITDPSQIKIQ